MRRRWLESSLGALALVVSARGAWAVDRLPTEYSPPRDIAEHWAMVLVVLIILAAMALIASTLATRRGRLTELHSKWLLFVGVGLLPIPAILLSTAVGMEHSKGVSFCNSCHAMDPFIDDMRKADSDLLAAVHFKNRFIQKEHCYSCHSDYGIFGTVEAKMAGLGHVYMDATKDWERPIEINKPYQYRICLNCHAGGLGFENREDHEGVIEMVMEGDIICSDCHESAHPSRAERGSAS